MRVVDHQCLKLNENTYENSDTSIDFSGTVVTFLLTTDVIKVPLTWDGAEVVSVGQQDGKGQVIMNTNQLGTGVILVLRYMNLGLRSLCNDRHSITSVVISFLPDIPQPIIRENFCQYDLVCP